MIVSALGGRVETVFGDTVAAVEDDGGAVHVTFESGTRREFDLVVGADGLHSGVRELVLGGQERFERYLGMVVAVFEVTGYRPRDELTAVMYAEIGFQLLRVSLRDDVIMFCFSLRDDGGVVGEGPRARQALLRRRLTGAGWEVPAVLDAMESAPTFYFDRASQIRMPSWSRGRTALAVRNTAMRLMGLPHMPNLVMRRSLCDTGELPAMPISRTRACTPTTRITARNTWLSTSTRLGM